MTSPDAGDQFLSAPQDGRSEEDQAATVVPSAHQSLAASRGAIPTHAGSLTSLPDQPPAQPSAGDAGPAGSGDPQGLGYPGVNPDPPAGPLVDPSVAADVG